MSSIPQNHGFNKEVPSLVMALTDNREKEYFWPTGVISMSFPVGFLETRAAAEGVRVDVSSHTLGYSIQLLYRLF
jgi:hypothetical protein